MSDATVLEFDHNDSVLVCCHREMGLNSRYSLWYWWRRCWRAFGLSRNLRPGRSSSSSTDIGRMYRSRAQSNRVS
jgi:hypothetical protein